MATSMLPILLLGGAALFLMTRGRDDDAPDADESISPSVETLGNVAVLKPGMSPADMAATIPYPVIMVSSTAWPLELISVRMKPLIEANPGINFVFAPIDVIVAGANQWLPAGFGLDMGVMVPDNVVLVSANVDGDTGYAPAAGMIAADWDVFDSTLVDAIAYLNGHLSGSGGQG